MRWKHGLSVLLTISLGFISTLLGENPGTTAPARSAPVPSIDAISRILNPEPAGDAIETLPEQPAEADTLPECEELREGVMSEYAFSILVMERCQRINAEYLRVCSDIPKECDQKDPQCQQCQLLEANSKLSCLSSPKAEEELIEGIHQLVYSLDPDARCGQIFPDSPEQAWLQWLKDDQYRTVPALP